MRLTEETDALSVAVTMEKRAITLYERIAQLIRDPELLAAVNELLADERTHLCRFRGLLTAASPAAVSPERDVTDAMAADVLFPGGLMAMTRTDALTGALALYRFAADNEADAVEKYTAFADRSEGDVREAFLTIANEESGHLEELNRKIAEMEKLRT